LRAQVAYQALYVVVVRVVEPLAHVEERLRLQANYVVDAKAIKSLDERLQRL